jgi:16S rRNA (guanine527-N7)-methyltransferase
VSRDPAEALDGAAREKLETVLALLAEERASVSSVVDQRAWRVHVLDSLTGLEVPDLRAAERVADVGAGAGFPGLALAVALPEAQVDLIESVTRKCEFMRRSAEEAGITNVTVRNTRSEDWAAAKGREAYDAVTARAVGRLSTLAELASPLLKPKGLLVAWKGKRDADEEQQLERASEALAMRPETILDVGNRAGSAHRHLHVIRKTGPTPANLPRKPGIAKKRPKG